MAATFDCKIVEKVLSHQHKQFVINWNKVVQMYPIQISKWMMQNLREMKSIRTGEGRVNTNALFLVILKKLLCFMGCFVLPFSSE